PAALKVGKDSTLSDAPADAVDAATSWIDGKVIVKDMQLKDVLPVLNKYYALTLDVADKSLLSRPVTMEAALDSKQKAIDALEASAQVKFYYDGAKPM